MKISDNRAFLLGSGFGFKIEGYEDKRSKERKILDCILSIVLTAVTVGVFFLAGPLIGRVVHNKHELSEVDEKISGRVSPILRNPTPPIPQIATKKVPEEKIEVKEPKHKEQKPLLKELPSNLTERRQLFRGPRGSITDFPNHDPEKLREIQAYLDHKNMGLWATPPVPKKSYPVYGQNAARYVEKQQNPRNKAMAQKIVDKIQHLTLGDLEKGLKSCVDQLNKRIKETPYSVGYVAGKSQQWVAGLSLKYLDRLPASDFTLNDLQGTIDVITPGQSFNLPRDENNLVIFDDCAYSGRQLIDNLKEIHDQIKASRKKEATTVYVVIPFMTQSVYDKLSKLQAEWTHPLKLQVITSEKRINRVFGDVLELSKETNTQRLDRLVDQDDLKALGEVTNYSFDPDRFGQTLCYTDWRYPDMASFWQHFGRQAMKIDGKEIQEKEYFMPRSEDIERPYGFSQEMADRYEKSTNALVKNALVKNTLV